MECCPLRQELPQNKVSYGGNSLECAAESQISIIDYSKDMVEGRNDRSSLNGLKRNQDSLDHFDFLDCIDQFDRSDHSLLVLTLNVPASNE